MVVVKYKKQENNRVSCYLQTEQGLNQFKSIFEEFHEGILIVNDKSEILLCNRSLEKLLNIETIIA